MTVSKSRSAKAFVLGATGLVGREIVDSLLKVEHVSSVTAFVRRPGKLKNTEPTDHKLREFVVDFHALSQPPTNWFDSLLPGDHAILFSALGTTLKQAGSKSQQYLVDFTYQLETAKEFSRVTALKKASSTLVLISASGANSDSLFFYPRIKGQLEKEILSLNLSQTRIIRPSLLLGERETKRLGESLAESVFHFIQKIGINLPKSIKPIHARDVAAQAIQLAFEEQHS